MRTLLSGYLLSSQGDRMLMGHSVEGRFPFLDADVVELANSLPSSAKLCGLDEKHVLKQAAVGLVPEEILARTKQPYRSPDALSFVGARGAGLGRRGGERACRGPGRGVRRESGRTALAKVPGDRGGEQFSNADNMALVGVLSTGLLHEQLVRRAPRREFEESFRTVVDHVPAPAAG